jgi:hypothetical protein
MKRATWRRRAGWVAALVLTALATACVGSIDRDEFTSEVNARGGGLSGDQLVAFVDEVSERTGVDDLLIRSASVSPLLVTLRVSDPARPEEVDSWTWSRGRVVGPEPAPNLAEQDLRRAFRPAAVDAALIERAIDEALARSAGGRRRAGSGWLRSSLSRWRWRSQ